MSAAISMTGARPGRRSRVAAGARPLVLAMALAGGAMALAGVVLPWLSFYAGLHTIAGVDSPLGSAAAVLAVGGMAGGLAFALSGGHAARWLLGLAGFGVMGIACWSGVNAIAMVRGLQDPLLVVQLGPGTLVLAVGGALMLATMLVPNPVSAQRGAVSPARQRGLLTAAVVAGGIIHLGVGLDHLTTSILVGAAMMIAGAAQVVLAAAATSRPASLPVRAAALGLSGLLVAAYALAVTVGLPTRPHPHTAVEAGHTAAGHVESVSPIGLATVGTEMLAVGIAAALLAGRGRREVAGRLSSEDQRHR